MALYAVCSAKGSPGVTTLVAAMALGWDRPVVMADLDAGGGDLALRYRDERGRPLDQDLGLVSLAALSRRSTTTTPIGPHLQVPLGGPPILVGVARPEQVGALGPAWGPLAQSLAAYEGDVLADCGRVTAGAAVTPVLAAADALLFVVRPTMEELYHLRERLGGLAEQLGSRDMHGRRIAVAVVGSDRNRTGASDVQRLLDASGSGATVVGMFVEDAKGALRLRYDLAGVPARSVVLRSAGVVGARVRELAGHDLTAAMGV